MSEAGVVTAGDLRQRCDALTGDLVARGIQENELLLHAPGGRDNPSEGKSEADCFFYHYTQLVRRHAILTEQEKGSLGGGADVEDALMASAAAIPEPVLFDDGVVRGVHPKSLHALRWLDSLDRQMQGVLHASAQIQDWREQGLLEHEGDAVTVLTPLMQSMAERLWLWVLTHEGPTIPFDDLDRDLEPPEWTRAATPEDVLRVFEAHLRVHAQRLAILTTAFPSETKSEGSRLSLAGFVSAIAHEKGISKKLLMRETSLGEIFAGAISAAQQAKEARARADAERAKERR